MIENNLTPPPELVQQWYNQASKLNEPFITYIATRAAKWGADQELEACCEWLREAKNHGLGYKYGQELADRYRAARRPKPPSLKQEALEALSRRSTFTLDRDRDTIRRALEQLDD
jgi:hypothetical protein